MADENTDVDELEEGEGQGKGKLFLIIGLALLIIIGAAAAFFLLSGDDEAADGEAVEEVAEVEEDEGEKIPQYYAVPREKEPGMVIIMQPGTPFKQAQLSFRIFTYSPELVDFLVKNDPMIRHHILNTLSLQDNKLFLDKAGREKMQEALKKTLVDLLASSKIEEEQKLSNKVEAVYFATFILQ